VKPLRILITAGPTIEPIDPVRFISNYSTGHMGYELARIAAKRNHIVRLVSGPVSIKEPAGIKIIHVRTARELQNKILKHLKESDVLLMASAVSDFRPKYFSAKKIKSNRSLFLKLAKNDDILKSIRQKERKNKVLVGFALETGDLIKNAAKKLKEKRLDLVAANKISRRNTPFGPGRKDMYILDKYGIRKRLRKTTKTAIASAILDTVEELCYTSA